MAFVPPRPPPSDTYHRKRHDEHCMSNTMATNLLVDPDAGAC